MSLVLAGERSGIGKTTVTLALLSYLQKHGLQVQSFKVGPDYIDPMFHEFITGRSCRNLDPVLTSEAYVQQCFHRHAQAVDYALVEGVMGLFDGASNAIAATKQPNTCSETVGAYGSTAHVARLVQIPVLLVVDCSRVSHSIAALVHGYSTFDPNLQIAGLVLNRVGSDRHLDLLKEALEPLGIPILGVLRRQNSLTIPDRHLGLVPTAELPGLKELQDQLTQVAETCFDWTKLLPLLEVHAASPCNTHSQRQDYSVIPPNLPLPRSGSEGEVFSLEASQGERLSEKVRIAVARDRAFSFYYPDNFDLLAELGAELVFWSPLEEAALPANVQGLYLGGGFPEMFAQQLAANESGRMAVKQAIQAGMPTYAECGGLMYLCDQIVDFAGNSWPMVGVLPTVAVMGKKLTLGYRKVEALQDSVILAKGAIAWGHEFHRSHLINQPTRPLFTFSNSVANDQPLQMEGWQLPNLHASYVHLHWGANPHLPARFLDQCWKFQAQF